jgi:hypothetical protein
MRTLLFVAFLSTMIMRHANAQPAGFGDCYSAPSCQGIVLGHWDYAFCSRAAAFGGKADAPLVKLRGS